MSEEDIEDGRRHYHDQIGNVVFSKKCWGLTCCEESDSEFYTRHRLWVEKGGCSIHYHQHRANRFKVISGSILVRLFWHDQQEDHILTEGNILDVPSLVVHQFIVLEPGIVIEEYWADRGGVVSNSDIIRLQVGNAEITP